MSQDQGSGQAKQSTVKPRESGMLPGETGFVLLVSLAILAIGFWVLFLRAQPPRADSDLLKAIQKTLSFHLVVEVGPALPSLAPLQTDLEVALPENAAPGRPGNWYKLLKKPELLGSHIAKVTEGVDEMGVPNLMIDLTPEGAQAFEVVTRNNVGKQLAFVIAGKVVSAPVIQMGISGGKVQVTGPNIKELVLGLKP